MSTLDLARLQFASTSIYHFLFVPVTIGLSLLVALLHTKWHRSGNADFKRLTKFFGKTPSKAVHPDEAVAIGAALYAFSLTDNTNLKLQLLDVIPMGIGLEKADGQMHVVFPRNSPIPNAKQVTGTTSVNNQTELIMRIWQGDHDTAKANEQLGEFTFSGLRQGPAGQVRVEITFDVNIEGILTMTARDPDTGKDMKTTVRVTQS